MDDPPELLSLIESAERLLAAGDDDVAIALLKHQLPLLAVAAFDRLQRRYYWQRKDVPRVVRLSREGTILALTAADVATDLPEAMDLRSAAKTLAYNLGSFTWRGWDEPGIRLTSDATAAGQRAAALNLRLAEQLEKPARAQADAWWLVGAHAEFGPNAIDAFGRGKEIARATGDAGRVRMFDGFLALAHYVEDYLDDPDGADGRFRAAVDALATSGDAADAEYARQLVTAFRVYFGSDPRDGITRNGSSR